MKKLAVKQWCQTYNEQSFLGDLQEEEKTRRKPPGRNLAMSFSRFQLPAKEMLSIPQGMR
jgi:hypothetical protein